MGFVGLRDFFFLIFASFSLGLCFMTAAALPLERGEAGWARVARNAPAGRCEKASRTESTGRGSIEDQRAVVGAGSGGIRSHVAWEWSFMDEHSFRCKKCIPLCSWCLIRFGAETGAGVALYYVRFKMIWKTPALVSTITRSACGRPVRHQSRGACDTNQGIRSVEVAAGVAY